MELFTTIFVIIIVVLFSIIVPYFKSATINWHSNNDSVKIEVWDVVDKAFNISKNKVASGKNSVELLDSSVVDIYMGTQAVIFIISPFSLESLQYVR